MPTFYFQHRNHIGSIQNSTQNYTTSGGARPHASLWAVLNYNDNRSPRWKQPSNFKSSWSFWNVIWFLYRAPFFACFFFLRSEKNVEWFESSCTVSVCLESPVRCQEIQIDSQQHSENVGGSKIGKIVTNFLSLETTVALREHENQTCSRTTESITWVWESSCKSWFVSVRPDLGEDWNLNSPLHLVFLSKHANKLRVFWSDQLTSNRSQIMFV